MPAVMSGFESVAHGFFDTTGGSSTGLFKGRNVALSVGDDPQAVQENRRGALATIGCETAVFVFAGPLVHGNAVYVVQPDDRAKDIAGFDAIISNVSGVAIGLSVADCVPVLLYDPEHAAIGVVHAGWRGLENGVVSKTITAMTESYGTDPSQLRAAVGPCMCADDYEVGTEVAEQFNQSVVVQRAGSLFLDMRKEVAEQLSKAGVGHISHDRRCTYEDAALFSYRKNNITGRQLAVIAL